MEKTCIQCALAFTLTEADLGFFEKMRVAPPDLCPQCGVNALMAFRNERVLYRRKCDKCAKDTLSLYHPKADYVVYCHECWWADDWDGSDYAMEYDPSRPLLEQFKILQHKVPREALIIVNSTNCDYGNYIRDSKNCYFCVLTADVENAMYSMWIASGTKDCINSRKVLQSELVAYCLDISKCNNCTFLRDSSDCSNCHFSYDLRGCTNCILSSNLRGKSYYIRNKQYTKEEYEIESAKLLNGSYATQEANKKEYYEVQSKAIHRYMNFLKTEHSVGNYLQECSDCNWCFDGFKSEHIKAGASILNAREAHYNYSLAARPVEFVYGSSTINGGSNIVLSFNCVTSSDCRWSDSLISSSQCIASVGLKRKEYSILNKQYIKEEYEALLEQLLAQTELREFLPPAFSAFAYNESCAQDYYPLTKEAALARGYSWQDDIPFTSGKETVQPQALPDGITEVTDQILQEILKCVECSRNYRIVPDELGFYRRFMLPLPRNCPQCRLKDLHNERLPFMLWHRECTCGMPSHFHGAERCPNEFETAYAPERPERVFCDQCYQAEVL